MPTPTSFEVEAMYDTLIKPYVSATHATLNFINSQEYQLSESRTVSEDLRGYYRMEIDCYE